MQCPHNSSRRGVYRIVDIQEIETKDLPLRVSTQKFFDTLNDQVKDPDDPHLPPRHFEDPPRDSCIEEGKKTMDLGRI